MLAELPFWILALLTLVGIVAGFVDTLAGGGGMLTIPSLLLAGLPPDAALATNKLQGSCGTLLATWYFVKRGQIQFRRLLPGIAACALGAACGTLTVQYLPKEALQQALPLLLAVVALIFRRGCHTENSPSRRRCPSVFTTVFSGPAPAVSSCWR